MSAPAVPTEIKAVAAQGLLERLAEKTALVRLFRYNAAMKHGVPIESRETASPTITLPPEPRPVPERQSLPWGMMAAILAMVATGAVLGYLLAYRNTPREIPAAVSQTVSESPLQYIEDKGGHLP